MSLSHEARSRLAAQQAALVAALVAQGEPPPGFEPNRLQATAASLARKRAKATAQAWPGLAHELGPRFGELFAAYARTTPLPQDGGSLADGRAFARWLANRKELSEAGRLQALAVDLHYALTPKGLVRRKAPACKAVWLKRSRRIIVGISVPRLGAHWFSVPLTRH